MRVTNVTARLIMIAGLRLKPGDTEEVPEKYEAGVRKSPCFRAGWLREGKVEMPPSPHNPKKGFSLAELSPSKAITAVGREKDLSTLVLWSESETRPEVLDAIKAQAEKL